MLFFLGNTTRGQLKTISGKLDKDPHSIYFTVSKGNRKNYYLILDLLVSIPMASSCVRALKGPRFSGATVISLGLSVNDQCATSQCCMAGVSQLEIVGQLHNYVEIFHLTV